MVNTTLRQDTKRIPIRIWVSLERLIPEEDIVVGNEGVSELVIDITPDKLLTLSKINERGIISKNLRPLLEYAPMRTKPDRMLFYPNAYDSIKMATYHDYKARLIKAGIK